MNFVKTTSDKFVRLEQKSRLTKNQYLSDGNQLIEVHRSSCRCHYDSTSSTFHIILLFPVTMVTSYE